MNFARAAAPLPLDRRAAPRVQVACDARLRTSFSIVVGELWDLSATGARFLAGNAPREGVTALLEWETHEVLCRVVWSQEGTCGLQFDRPITYAVIENSVAAPARSETVATLGNIPLGKRRSLIARAEAEQNDPAERGPSSFERPTA